MLDMYNFFGFGTFNYKLYYPKGKIREEGKYNHLNQRHGIIKGYYPNGKLRFVNVYNNGILEMENQFHRNNELKQLTIYYRGKWIKFQYKLQ